MRILIFKTLKSKNIQRKLIQKKKKKKKGNVFPPVISITMEYHHKYKKLRMHEQDHTHKFLYTKSLFYYARAFWELNPSPVSEADILSPNTIA